MIRGRCKIGRHPTRNPNGMNPGEANAKVSDGSLPPMKLNLYLGESYDSRSLHRLVRFFDFVCG